MYSTLTLVYKYFQYYLSASNKKGHGIHSPFVFNFIQKVLNNKTALPIFEQIEQTRNHFLNTTQKIPVWDQGAGSRNNSSKTRSIHYIARTSLKSKKFGQLFYRMVDHYQPPTILELGTSLGITTSYLAAAAKGKTVVTMEGAPAVASLAKEGFQQNGFTNIQSMEGNFDQTLPVYLDTIDSIGLAFIDGNHQYEPTIQYFNALIEKSSDTSIFIFDDIHWSKEMESVWAYIKLHERVTLTIDLFSIGIVFFRKEQKEKTHFTILF